MMQSPLKLARCTQTTQECVIYTLESECKHMRMLSSYFFPFSQSFNDLVERQQRFLLIPNLRYLSFSVLAVLNKFFFYVVFFVYFKWIWISKCMYDLHFQLYAHECRFFFFFVFILMECCQHMTREKGGKEWGRDLKSACLYLICLIQFH